MGRSRLQSLCDALQECVVVNCIGTPINMNRVLCQVGQKVADHSRESLLLLEGAWGVFDRIREDTSG